MGVGKIRGSKLSHERNQTTQDRRWCWKANTDYLNKKFKLELQQVRESPCSSSLAKSHFVRKFRYGLSNGNLTHVFHLCVTNMNNESNCKDDKRHISIYHSKRKKNISRTIRFTNKFIFKASSTLIITHQIHEEPQIMLEELT